MSPNIHRSLFVTAVFAATVACASASGCAKPVLLIGTPIEDASASSPGFTPPEEDGGSSGQPVPTVPMCVATECPHPYATCARAGGFPPYQCETNLLIDDSNCGACGNACPSASSFPELNMETHCIDGTCHPACSLEHIDCNKLADDGCEIDVRNDPENCGACGNKCPEVRHGVRRCVQKQCTGECSPPNTWCAPDICTDLMNDKFNCGACGNMCPPTPPDAGPPPPQMKYVCEQGECGHLICENNWADCNNNIDLDGCEADISSDPKNCGACGKACAPGQPCIFRPEAYAYECGCRSNETSCNGVCIDLLSDIYNCGACGNICPTPANGVASCNKGFCEDSCLPSWGDCDNDSRNGCETNLLVDARHCGGCGTPCDTAAGQPCINGRCLMVECDAGLVTK